MKAARIVLAAMLAVGAVVGCAWHWALHGDRQSGLACLLLGVFLSQFVMPD